MKDARARSYLMACISLFIFSHIITIGNVIVGVMAAFKESQRTLDMVSFWQPSLSSYDDDDLINEFFSQNLGINGFNWILALLGIGLMGPTQGLLRGWDRALKHQSLDDMILSNLFYLTIIPVVMSAGLILSRVMHKMEMTRRKKGVAPPSA